MIGLWCKQILAVLRIEMRKTFFARRGIWVYLLALAPVLLFTAHTIIAPQQQNRLEQISAQHRVSKWALLRLQMGMTRVEVEHRLGPPYRRDGRSHNVGDGQVISREFYHYTDGQTDTVLIFNNDRLTDIRSRHPENLETDNTVFATIFQFYYLRLAIFFGCVGIFTNLFRGEMVDKNLHFYLLTPMRREVLLVGKFFAGLIATSVIFTIGTALQLTALLWMYRGPILNQYLHDVGWSQIGAYLGVTALACAGYGSIFLAAGLIWRNPIIPAAIVLVWESANVFLPATLKTVSVIFYLQSLCPVVASPENDMSMPLQLLLSATQPPKAGTAIMGLIVLVLVLLVIAARWARRLEINYGTD